MRYNKAMRTLLIDDFRTLLGITRIARTFDEGIEALKAGPWDGLYLDHDLGACKECTEKGLHVGDMKTPETTFLNYCHHANTGYDIMLWLEEHQEYLPKSIILVTSNPVGRQRMKVVIDRLYK